MKPRQIQFPLIPLLTIAFLAACAVHTPAPIRSIATPVVGPPDTVLPTATALPTALRAALSPTPRAAATVLADDPVILAAGDIADCSLSHDGETARLLAANPDATILAIGDTAYPSGRDRDYANCYAPTWGRFLSRTKPVPGNHEYETAGAAGYFKYFGKLTGSNPDGYYSFDLGAWHLVALNSERPVNEGAPQIEWLRDDLAAHKNACTLAYWHQPRFSSGPHSSNAKYTLLWQILYDAGAEIVLGGHDHDYERFAPQTAAGLADPARGIRQFVAGTGGASLYPFIFIQHNSEVRDDKHWGVLKLTLRQKSYDWKFLSTSGEKVDEGTAECH